MPLVTVFAVGTLAWLVVLLVFTARHLLGNPVTGNMVAMAAVGAALGITGIVWARVHNRRQEARERARRGGPK